MTTVGAYDAKTHFAALLAKVRNGEVVEITWHGQLVARIVPAEKKHKRFTKKEAIERLRNIKRVPLEGVTIRELIDEGRNRHTK